MADKYVPDDSPTELEKKLHCIVAGELLLLLNGLIHN